MKAIMNISNLKELTDLEGFLQGNQNIAYSLPDNKAERYRQIERILVKFRYLSCTKKDKGIITRFLMKLTAYSRQQLVRLIAQYRRTGHIIYRPAKNGFSKKYTIQDITELAIMDGLHNTPCGHTIKKLMERSYYLYKDKKHERLMNISVAHIYNLRVSTTYKRQRITIEKTKPRKINIGERRKPQANGKPGYIRIDTVHQGDLDKKKGVYHINAIDEVTQFEVVLSVEKISESFLMPILEKLLSYFPFDVKGFHSDNGSEYVNHNVARLLEKLRIEFTKSRSRHSNDNALAESKNASIVRKIFGYIHIQQKHAPRINEFNIHFLYPYINFHRPCFYPETVTDKKGKERKKYHYKNMMTPYEKFKSLASSEMYLKQGVSFEILDKFAMEMTDNEAADLLNKERQILFNKITEQKNTG